MAEWRFLRDVGTSVTETNTDASFTSSTTLEMPDLTNNEEFGWHEYSLSITNDTGSDTTIDWELDYSWGSQSTGSETISAGSTVEVFSNVNSLDHQDGSITFIISAGTGDATTETVSTDRRLEPNVTDVLVKDTANPFANKGVAFIEDTDGTRFEKYSRGTRVAFSYDEEGGDALFDDRFVGYVVERRTANSNGADRLEVEAYSFDQFLRRGEVTVSTEGKTRSTALNDIITEDTPVSWDGTNVSVVNDDTLTRELQGETVENAIQIIRKGSANEDFGVNNQLEFVFEPSEIQSTSRDIDNTQWFNYDIPERGKRATNQVDVWYADGNKRVTVSNGADQEQLQDTVGTSRPVELTDQLKRPNIDYAEDARQVGRNYLNNNGALLTGTVTTYGLFDAQPGDVINIEIIPRGINQEFRIAEIQYEWGTDSTTLTIVEKRGNQDDLLVSLSEDLRRVELADVDRQGLQITTTSSHVGIEVDTSGEARGFEIYESGNALITNELRSQIRDGWTGDGNVSVAEMAIGDDASNLSRANTELENEIERSTVSESLQSNSIVEYVASFSSVLEDEVKEIGLFDSSGNLLARVAGEFVNTGTTGVSPSDITCYFTLDIDNDTAFERGVVTSEGLQTIRDIIADNSPTLPTLYKYGDANITPSTSDVALGNEIYSGEIGLYLVQSATTTSEFASVADPLATTPVTATGGQLELSQSAWVWEAESQTLSGTTVSDGSYSDGTAVNINTNVSQTGDTAQYSFTPAYDIAEENVRCNFRIDPFDGGGDGDANVPKFAIRLNGDTMFDAQFNTTDVSTRWDDISTNGDYNGGDLQAGTTYNLEIEITDGTLGDTDDALRLDVVCVYDNQYNYNFDNTVDANGYLSGPELYPDAVTLDFKAVSTEFGVTSLTLNSTWNNIDNGQALRVSNNTTGAQEEANVAKTTGTFSEVSQYAIGGAVFDRYGSRTTATPTSGHLGQAIEEMFLYLSDSGIVPVDIGKVSTEKRVPAGELTGQTIREGGQTGPVNQLLTHVSFAPEDIESNEILVADETLRIKNP